MAGVFRIINEPDTSSQLIDYGGRVGMRANDVYYSFEALGRYRFADIPDVELNYGRVVGGITYALSRATHVSFTFGKNFSYNFSDSGSLLASVGLTIGRGQMAIGTINDAN